MSECPCFTHNTTQAHLFHQMNVDPGGPFPLRAIAFRSTLTARGVAPALSYSNPPPTSDAVLHVIRCTVPLTYSAMSRPARSHLAANHRAIPHSLRRRRRELLTRDLLVTTYG
jgi:hypothetical protein